MSPSQFWYGDMRLLKAYQHSYYSKISYEAWAFGQYNKVGYEVVMANAFAKKGAKKAEYPQWSDPMAKFAKPIITTENLEEEFRKQQVEQSAWLFNR